MQTIAEWRVALAVVAEPYAVPDHPRWFGDESGSVAIYWSGGEGAPPCALLRRGQGFVAVQWGPLAIVGCYVSPNRSLADYEAYLDEVANCIRECQPRPLIALGDFNAHTRAWGNSRDDPKGETVMVWAAGLDLRLMNQGSVSTCVRWQGESIVDLTWATPPAMQMLSGWRVAEEVVTLSDHRHIVFNVALRQPDSNPSRRDSSPPRRWCLKRLDQDKLEAAAIVASWPENAEEVQSDPEGEANWFRGTMAQICDLSMPRISRPKRKAAYWWSAEIARLRAICLRCRRQYTRARRRRRRAPPEEIARLYGAYRAATKALQIAITNARSRSWKELLEGLNKDPWGRPYRMVLGKLRPWSPPLTEILDPDLLERVISTLFPEDRSSPEGHLPSSWEWQEEMGVTVEELDRAISRLKVRNTAPGPDGIPGRALVLSLAALGNRLRQLFTSCLRCAKFPTAWKEARLVLLKKDGRAADSPSAYRPICLLDEIGKLFERIVATRLSGHLSRVGPDLADSQFGFRRERSTVDAIMRVRSLSEQTVSRGGVALAISLDIVNAFNSLPWDAIRRALAHHQVPPYLHGIIGDYLRDRYIVYMAKDGRKIRREIRRGVPQGSVLGPLLWNLAYDAVLRVDLPAGVNIVCYADDTLVIASGITFERTKELAELGVEVVVAKIHELGLEIAPHKTEALWFHKLPRGREPPNSCVRVGGSEVRVGRYMKYLGLHLDSRWGFEEHFERLVPRIERVAGAMHRLLPNLGGPTEEVRRLYAGVIRSVALYGAPVWAKRLAIRRCRTKIYSVQRRMAIRIVRGYRTISFEAATILARFPPLDILAEMDARVYDRIRALRQSGGSEPEEALESVKRQERQNALATWRTRLEERYEYKRVIGAILPVFDAWMQRRVGRLTYRLTQIITGHGCFGDYLCKIGREATANCFHCDGQDQDSASHTLAVCPAWERERTILVNRIGRDLSLPAVVSAMLSGDSAWRAVATFCESVMTQKEASERDRERADPARRRRRQGVRHGPPIENGVPLPETGPPGLQTLGAGASSV
ncbi:unnamed protein product [Parnassius mnemosyne]|uniref:Reverse transcriptase domain-containing protein n=1 Tax=Parnassius mnemosyne TaxID=213953 RepID=A0AAV1LV12_9NEOP